MSAINWLEKLGGVFVRFAGVNLEPRDTIEFEGTNVSVIDNPIYARTVVTVASESVADDIVRQGGTDINRVHGLNRVPFKTPAGAAAADGTAPPVGGTWVYNERAAVNGFRAKKPVMPGYIDVEDYGAVPDWDGATGTDNLAAFNAAFAAAENAHLTNKHSVHVVANGHFYLSGTLHVPRGGTLMGSGGGDPTHLPGTMLVFPMDVTGIRLHGSSDIDFPGGMSAPVGDNPQVKNLTVYCWQERAGTTGNGIHSSTTCSIEGVCVQGFAESGVYIAAEGGSLVYPGIAAGSYIVNSSSSNNGLHGFFILGADSNVGLFAMCFADVNQGHGFHDEGGVGNTYIACYCQGNLGEPGGFSIDGRNHDFWVKNDGINSSLFLGCYSEASIDHIYAPAGAIGGLLGYGGSFISDSNAFSLSSGGVASNGPISFKTAKSTSGARVEVGSASEANRALTLENVVASVAGDPLYLDFNATDKLWDWVQGSGYGTFLRLPTSAAESRSPAPWAPNGVFLGDIALGTGKALHFATADTVPDTKNSGAAQTYEVGDVIWNTSAVQGGSAGRICTTAGTQGTLNGGTTTGDITIGTATLAVNDYTGLAVGQYITIAGVSGIKKVVSVTVTSAPAADVVVDSNADATVAAAAVAFSHSAFTLLAPIHTRGDNSGQYTKAMADADQSLTAANVYSASIVKVTGALTSDRTLTIPAPAGDEDSYQRTFRNQCTGSNLIISTGAGTTVTMTPGLNCILTVDAAGVDRAVTGV